MHHVSSLSEYYPTPPSFSPRSKLGHNQIGKRLASLRGQALAHPPMGSTTKRSRTQHTSPSCGGTCFIDKGWGVQWKALEQPIHWNVRQAYVTLPIPRSWMPSAQGPPWLWTLHISPWKVQVVAFLATLCTAYCVLLPLASSQPGQLTCGV